MARKAKRKKVAKKAKSGKSKTLAKKKGGKGKPVKKQRALIQAKRALILATERYCYNMTADPRWVIRCEYGPDGRCTRNCQRIPASQVPSG
jgi:hypothetical protein